VFYRPVLVPEKTSGLSFHEGRTCRDKCSSCHGKFGLLDTPCHIAQIKNPNKQKACLESMYGLLCVFKYFNNRKQQHIIVSS